MSAPVIDLESHDTQGTKKATANVLANRAANPGLVDVFLVVAVVTGYIFYKISRQMYDVQTLSKNRSYFSTQNP
jgi:hypothetical protein